MGNSPFDKLIQFRKNAQNVLHKAGTISAKIVIDEPQRADLKLLEDCQVLDSPIQISGKTYLVDKLPIPFGGELEIVVTLYTKKLTSGRYYETFEDFLIDFSSKVPDQVFYINEFAYKSGEADQPALLKAHNDTVKLVDLLESVADYCRDDFDKELIYFQKRKLIITVKYNRNNLQEIDVLKNLHEQLTEAHDKNERIIIFNTELVTSLYEIKEEDRFNVLLKNFQTIYDSYLKSHSLYLQNFSYHDLKSDLDKEKLDYTKKIYSTVNEIQTKLISVPAAFLLILSQFDFTGLADTKNLLILIGSILFSILLEILLTNQFYLLKYIEDEIEAFKKDWKSKDIKMEFSDLITSFASLNDTSAKQRKFLWTFRCIIWSISAASVFMFLYYKR